MKNDKLAINLHIVYKNSSNSTEWFALNFLPRFLARQSNFANFRGHNVRAGLNAICKCFHYRNIEIPPSWFTLSMKLFKLNCKKLFNEHGSLKVALNCARDEYMLTLESRHIQVMGWSVLMLKTVPNCSRIKQGVTIFSYIPVCLISLSRHICGNWVTTKYYLGAIE